MWAKYKSNKKKRKGEEIKVMNIDYDNICKTPEREVMIEHECAHGRQC
jgi:hypothetical protein